MSDSEHALVPYWNREGVMVRLEGVPESIEGWAQGDVHFDSQQGNVLSIVESYLDQKIIATRTRAVGLNTVGSFMLVSMDRLPTCLSRLYRRACLTTLKLFCASVALLRMTGTRSGKCSDLLAKLALCDFCDASRPFLYRKFMLSILPLRLSRSISSSCSSCRVPRS